MKTAKIGLVILAVLHLCYGADDIGDVVVQEENFVGAYDEDPSVLDLSSMNVDKLISETDDDELDDIFRSITRITVSDISFKSLKKLCQYNLVIDVESQDDVLDCAEVRERRLVKRENDDNEEGSDLVGSGDSGVDGQEQGEEPALADAAAFFDLESGDASGDSEVEIQEATPTDAVKEYEIAEAQANVTVDEAAKETDAVDSIPNAEESKNENPEVAPVDAGLPEPLANENVEDNVPVTEAPIETSQAPETVEETVPATTEPPNSGSEDETSEPTEIVAETTAANEEAPAPIPTDQEVVPDEIKKVTNDEIPSILSRGSDLFPAAVPVQPEETTVTTEASTVTEKPKPDSPRKLGEVDSIDGEGNAQDPKQKENIKTDTARKAANQTDDDQQATAKSGISGLNVFIFFVIAAAVAGAAIFGYKMYKNRQVSYSTVNTGEDFGKELQEVKVKRPDDDRNADGQNAKDAKPLMFNDLDITEVEDQQPHTPQPTPRTFKVTPSSTDRNPEEDGESNTKKYDHQ